MIPQSNDPMMQMDHARSQGDHDAPTIPGPSSTPSMAQPCDPCAMGDTMRMDVMMPGMENPMATGDMSRCPMGVDHFGG